MCLYIYICIYIYILCLMYIFAKIKFLKFLIPAKIENSLI